MSPPQSNPELYLHIRVVISIIVGLCITTLLNGFARFVQHPKRAKVSILHLGWAISLLLWIIHFWWWKFRLVMVTQWTFASYFFIIFYAILFYFLCTLLFPSDLQATPATKSISSPAAIGLLESSQRPLLPTSSIPISRAPLIFILLESNIRSGSP